MDKKVVKVKENQDIKQAYDLMILHEKEVLPVVNEEKKFVGLIGMFDIVMQLFKKKGIIG